MSSNTGKSRNPVRATAAHSANAVRRQAEREEKKAARKAVKRRFPGLKPPVGSKWMLDEVIESYLSNEDAVCSIEIVEAMIKRAANGDVRAAEFLANRSQGSPRQKIDVNATGVLTVQMLDSLLPDPPNGG